MSRLRVLITNMRFAGRTGTETYVRDLALGLRERGHDPVVYSTELGDIAQEIEAAGVPVIDDLNAVDTPPDIIHGNHHLETMTALLRFPGVPAVYVCHSWAAEESAPPRFPRIIRYVAVDDACRERLVLKEGIPKERVQVVLNAVDMKRFTPRGPLPLRPQHALVFSNYASDQTHLRAVRAACARVGVEVDVIGRASGKLCANPETVLKRYDLIFAKARCALEALAVGAAVVLCDASGVGPMVTMRELPRLRRLNFGFRMLGEPAHPDVLAREIARYDPQDAAEVSLWIRANAGLEAATDAFIALYRDILTERAQVVQAADLEAEDRSAAAYLRWLTLSGRGAPSLTEGGCQRGSSGSRH